MDDFYESKLELDVSKFNFVLSFNYLILLYKIEKDRRNSNKFRKK